MTIAQVQKKERSPLNTVISGGSIAVTFDAAPSQGNLLLLAIGSAAQAPTTLSLPSGWSQLIRENAAGDTALPFGGSPMRFIFAGYKVAGASESATVTVTTNANVAADMIILEYSGIASSPLDQSVTAFDIDNSVGNLDIDLGTTGTTTQADELAVAMNVGATRTGQVMSNGFTVQNSQGNRITVGTKVLSATGTVQTTSSWSTTGNNSAGGIFTFKATAPAANPGQFFAVL